MSKKKKEKIVYKEKVNWRKELSLLPGYLIVTIWVLFTAVFLLWILGASLSTCLLYTSPSPRDCS